MSKSNAGFGSTDWFLGFGLSVAGGGELVMESRESPIVSVAANQAHLKFTRGHGVATPVQTEPTSSKISAAALGPHTGRAPPDPILECRWSASVVFSKTLTRRPPTNHQPRPPGSFPTRGDNIRPPAHHCCFNNPATAECTSAAVFPGRRRINHICCVEHQAWSIRAWWCCS